MTVLATGSQADEIDKRFTRAVFITIASEWPLNHVPSQHNAVRHALIRACCSAGATTAAIAPYANDELTRADGPNAASRYRAERAPANACASPSGKQGCKDAGWR